MKKQGKGMLMMLAVVLVLATVLGACGSKPASTTEPSPKTTTEPSSTENTGSGDIDTSKEVTLKMVLIGGKPVDFDAVFGELNTKLKEKINATVEVEFLEWSDWQQKYPLMFAANQDFDLVYSANWAMYNDQALKGGFLELTEDMLAKYAPKTWEAQTKAAWDQAKVGGKIFMVPQNSSEIVDKVVLVRQDLIDKYNMEPVTSPETFAAYLKTLAANEKGMTPYGARPSDGFKRHELDDIVLTQANNWATVDFDLPFVIDKKDPAGKIFNVYDTPEALEVLKYYKDLADNGAWSKNVLSEKSDVWQEMKVGKVGSRAHNLGTMALNLAEAHRDTDMKMTIADLTPDSYKKSAISTQNGMSIHATSKNVERSLMLIDLLQNDKEIHDLTMYGIANKHYNPIGDDKLTPGADTANYTGFSNWGWNSQLNRKDDAYPEEATKLEVKFVESVYNYPLETFVFDNSKVKNYAANVGNVMLRYGIPLQYGMVADIEAGQAELMKQLKAAGIDNIQEEMQAQIDAFLAAQK